MAHFARVVDGVVAQVILAEPEFLETLGDSLPGEWVETKPKTRGGQHPDDEPLRKNFAGVGFSYDAQLDAFIPQRPFGSWTLDTETCLWEPPTPYPADGQHYRWEPNTDDWVALPTPEEILQMARAAAPKIKLSRFLAQAVTRGWVTAQEAEDYSRKVSLPSVLVDAKDAVCMTAHPDDQKARDAIEMQIRFDLWNLTEVGRLDLLIEPMVDVLANRPEPLTVTDADLDEVFDIKVP